MGKILEVAVLTIVFIVSVVLTNLFCEWLKRKTKYANYIIGALALLMIVSVAAKLVFQ